MSMVIQEAFLEFHSPFLPGAEMATDAEVRERWKARANQVFKGNELRIWYMRVLGWMVREFHFVCCSQCAIILNTYDTRHKPTPTRARGGPNQQRRDVRAPLDRDTGHSLPSGSEPRKTR